MKNILSIVVVGTILVGLLLFWLARSPALNIDSSAPFTEQKAVVQAWYSSLCAKGMHSGTILIARKDEILIHENCGYRNAKGTSPITERSTFNLASVSKQFTAMGIMILAHRGQLSIDDPISQWLPEIEAPEVTIRHLLHHTSGLADYMTLVDEYLDENTTLTFDGLLSLFKNHRPAQHFLPGEKFEYSNTGYVLLALIIERASGMAHAKFMDENIFQPLGMDDSAAFNLLSAPDMLAERVFGFRKRYWLFGENVPYDLKPLDGITGDGGIYSSALDLQKWSRALSSDVLLPQQLIKDAFKTGRTNNGKQTDYGFGWNLDKKGTFSHHGLWVGFSTAIIFNPKREMVFVILDNSTNLLRLPGIITKLEKFTDAL
jgi:CubicO group peptidase (beta-lactamase class C family)